MAKRRSEEDGRQVGIEAVEPPIHPGAILREEFMIPLGITASSLAQACGLSQAEVEQITGETLDISRDTALKLGQYFGTSAQFWMNLQATYDVQCSAREIGETAVKKGIK